MIRKSLLILSILASVLLLALAVFLNTGIQLPAKTDEIIEKVNNETLPELVTGTTGQVSSSGVNIWYEVISPDKTPRGSVVLIMGAISSAIAWPVEFVNAFVDAGYRVIRFDHRGLGLSDWVQNWDPAAPYNLNDMSQDVIAIMDAVELKRAHIIGASMGGMIAQRLAIQHPDRVQSLTLFSSSADIQDPEFSSEAKPVYADALRLFLKYGITATENDLIKFAVGFTQLLAGDKRDDVDVAEIARQVMYELRKRNGYNSNVMQQHTEAIKVSGSTYNELDKIRAPVLLIHGSADPLIPLSHAKKILTKISQSKKVWLQGAGHIITKSYMPKVMPEIFSLLGQHP